MPKESNCPKCLSENTYQDRNLWTCPDCFYEWNEFEKQLEIISSEEILVKDAHGTVLMNGDSVTVIKDLKVKGTSSTIKVGTKVKNIRLIESDNGHNISCKIDRIGVMDLKSEFVRKL